jgi:hypothetical protein
MSDVASEIARLRAALAASEARVETAEVRAETAERELAQARAVVSTSEAMIKHLRLEIARLRRDQYGHSSERRARLLDQMELQLEELEAAATEDEIAAEKAIRTTPVAGFERRRPARKPFPEHLPRERVVIEAPSACSCCGSDRLVKMGEDVTETLEVIPRQWKVIQTVREKFPGAPPVHASNRPLDALPLRGPAFTLPLLREDQPAAGAVPCHPARMGGGAPLGDNPVREVRPAPAAQPAGRALCPGGGRS